MVRQIINIDQELCIGCGLCVSACQEGAIGLVDGKATLLREDHCDGLGNCLPMCPTGAITFEEREAAPFIGEGEAPDFSCPAMSFNFDEIGAPKFEEPKSTPTNTTVFGESALRHWPVQLQLVSANASFLANSDLLIAADCAAFAHGAFHETFMEDRVTLIGCPKLDQGDYAQKLAQIISTHSIRSITVARMEVPCCSGLAHAVQRAIAASGKIVPLAVVTISAKGEIVS
ncbi:MAG TPA: 4Fe-4S binding protein [Sphaerochaeta sp.]|nr:4Fe-4S binding protein [Sphaerochaeta sp.]